MTIRKYENMKRPIFTAVLATVTLLTAEAQSVTYNHDDAVMNQVTVQETASIRVTVTVPQRQTNSLTVP